MSAAFDDELIQSVASVVSTEARAFSNVGRAGLDFWTPNINPYKDPRWGRGLETPGEDPFRISNYVKHLLLGLEGGLSPPIRKVIATCKHFAAYDMEKWGGFTRHTFDAVVSTQDLAEYYLPPFQQCARDSNVGSVMCSYNSVNGIPACANSYLMNTILREHWGWTSNNQYITSDCDAIVDIYEGHNYTVTAAEAAGVAYNAGTDTVCEYSGITDVIGSYNQSFLTDDVLDRALVRQYMGLVNVGYFDPASNISYRSLSWADVNTPAAQKLARQSATDGFVLLKNDGLLPLSLTNLESVAIVGNWANATDQMLGNYNGIPPYTYNPLYAAENIGLTVNYADGPVAENSTTGNWTEPAVTAATNSDIILYFGGIDVTVEAEELDRYSISWSPSQLTFIEQLSALGKPLVIIQLGNQLDDTPLLSNNNISAILWAGYPGQDGGPAVFDVLTGVKNPAGRLPVTQYPAEYVDQVPMTDMTLRPSSTNPGRTYKFFNDSVLPFGYGLHYTNFSVSFTSLNSSATPSTHVFNISSLLASCNETNLDLCPFPTTTLPSVSITNTGTGIGVNETSALTSDFVLLAFLSGEYGPTPYPIKELAAYTRLRDLTAGESRTVNLDLTLGVLSRRNEIGNRVLYPGTYNVLVDVPTQATTSFELVGEEALLEVWPQP